MQTFTLRKSHINIWLMLLDRSAEILQCGYVRDNISVKTEASQKQETKRKICINTEWKAELVLTEVLDSVVALLVVHFDGLSVGTADAIADGVTTHHNVLVLWRRPADHDTVDQRADMERAGLVWYSWFWWEKYTWEKNLRRVLHLQWEIQLIECCLA